MHCAVEENKFLLRKIKSIIFTEKAVFKKRALFASKLDLNLRKKLVKCWVWSMALYCTENLTLQKVDQKHLESFEIWCWRRMEKIIWMDHVKDKSITNSHGGKEYHAYVGGPKRNRNFVIKNCVFIFRCYKFNHLQSTVHLMQCTGLNVFSTFRSSPETLAKWCLLMPPSYFSSPIPCPQNVFLWGLFSFGGIKRSRMERDRVNMAGGEAGSCCFWLKIVSHSRLCALARCRGEATTPHFAIPRSKSVGRKFRAHQTNQQDRQLFCDGLLRSVHEFSRCFPPFGRSSVALSEVGLQVTIHHSWSGKTTRKLVFSPSTASL